ncbi:hypothetical protein ABFV05_012175 [Capra hircus]
MRSLQAATKRKPVQSSRDPVQPKTKINKKEDLADSVNVASGAQAPRVPLSSPRGRAHATKHCPSLGSAGAYEAVSPRERTPYPASGLGAPRPAPRGMQSPRTGAVCTPLSADAPGAAPTPRTTLTQVPGGAPSPGSLDAGGCTGPGCTGSSPRETFTSRSPVSSRSS